VQLLQARDLAGHDAVVGNVGQRRAAPPAEPLVQQREGPPASPAARAVVAASTMCSNRLGVDLVGVACRT
jgi:hypothetical protein